MAPPKKSPNKVSKTIKVNLSLQTVEGLEGNKQVMSFECVSGDKNHPTDRGSFKIFRKNHPYRSRSYDVQMDYAMFFTADGKAFHQYHGPMPLSVVRAARGTLSEWFGLYDWAQIGTLVHVF